MPKPFQQIAVADIFHTLKPVAVRYPDGRMQAPHTTVWIIARGINIGLHTRLYFEDEPSANVPTASSRG